MAEVQSQATADRIIQLMPLIRKSLTSETFHGRKEAFSLVQFNVLLILLEEGPMIMTTLAKKLHSSKPNLTMLIDRMHKSNLVVRRERTDDRRVAEIDLTDYAKNQLLDKEKELQAFFQDRMSKLTEDEHARFHEALGVMLDILPKLQN